MGPEIIGWVSSAVLVLTISSQVLKQWRADSTKGVSSLLFIGQTVASTGLLVYSAILGDTVFIITNALMLVAAIVGLTILVHKRRSEKKGQGAHDEPTTEEYPPEEQAPRSLVH